MQKLYLPIFVAFAIFATVIESNAQCADGESSFELIVDTDAWAYEMYYELTPVDVECGGNIVASGVSGAYSACIDNGCYTVNGFDSYGDGWNDDIMTVTDSDGNVLLSWVGPETDIGSVELCIDNTVDPTACSEVSIDISGGSWPSEVSWNIVGGNELYYSGGNIDVGCGNTGNGTPGYTYYDNDAQITDMICLTTNSQVVLHHTDSYGDGGTDFYVLVDGIEVQFLDGSGYGDTWTIDVNTDGTIDHDTPCDALEIPIDGTTTMISNVGATGSYFEVAPPALGCNTPAGWCEGGATVSVWAKFTVEEEIRYQVQMCNTNTDFDSQLALWVNGACGDWSTYELIGANDDAFCEVGELYSSTAYTPCLPVGTEVYCQIDGWNGATGISEISVHPSEVEPYISSSVSQISCALESEFNPDGAIDVITMYDGLGGTVEWEGPFGYTGSGNYIDNLLPGVYNVEISSTCIGESYVASFEIINPEELELNYTINTTCESGEGGSVDLEITGGTGEYTIDWSGPNSYEFGGEDLPIVSSGDYIVEVSDANGCLTDLEIEIPFIGITPYSLGEDIDMCSGDIQIFLAPTGNYTYEWQDGSGSSIFILQTEEGVATTHVIGVSVSNEYGCELSDAVVVTVMNCVGIEEEISEQWSLYPNPTNGISTLNLEGVDNNHLCKIRDAAGRIIHSTQAQELTVFDAANFEAGIYLIEVLDNRGAVVWHSKAIVQ